MCKIVWIISACLCVALFSVGCGTGGGADTTPAPTARPATPTGLTATAVSGTQVSVSWNAVNGAQKYIVYGPNLWLADTTSNSFADTGVTAGHSYQYSISACNTTVCSLKSNAVLATTPGISTTEVYEVSAVSNVVGLTGTNSITIDLKNASGTFVAGTYNVSATGTVNQLDNKKYNGVYLIYPRTDGNTGLAVVPENGSVAITTAGNGLKAFFASDTYLATNTTFVPGDSHLVFDPGFTSKQFVVNGFRAIPLVTTALHINLLHGSGTYVVSSRENNLIELGLNSISAIAYSDPSKIYMGVMLYYLSPDGNIVLTVVPNNGFITIQTTGVDLYAFYPDSTTNLWNNIGYTALSFTKQ